MKTCPKCKKERQDNEFWKDKTRPDGYAWECIECSREKQKRWRNKNPNGAKLATKNWRLNNPKKVKQQYRDSYNKKKDLMNKIKESGCIICGEKDICCLDFHHIEDKDYEVTHLGAGSYKKILEEISKCVIVCCNCHRKIHFNKIKNPDTPIDVSGYTHLIRS